VIGTNTAETVQINLPGGNVRVQTALVPEGSRSFAQSSVNRLLFLLGDGDDSVSLAGNVGIEAFMDGGAGNDLLDAGSGLAVLLGSEGNDQLLGGTGRDILIGGAGADSLTGGPDDDVLLAGRTEFDLNDDAIQPGFDQALRAIATEWNSARSYTDRIANIQGQSTSPTFSSRLNGSFFFSTATVFNDGAQDQLTGESGRDWFLARTPEDTISDRNSNEIVTGI
jgi:Ca2+-binding RTX toxin-like protein